MRKKKETQEENDDSQDQSSDVGKMLKQLAGQFNKDGEDKIAWNLAKDFDNPTDVKEFISTGSTLLDYVISNRRNGGVPTGKLTEISGEEASGKSLLCAHILANTQKKNGLAVYIDTENAANPEFMQQVGVDLNKLLYLQPGSVESVFEAIEKCINVARAKDVKNPVTIIWDSVAATPPNAEIEGDYDPNSRIGVMAKALAKGLRKLTDTVGKDKVTLVFTNQLKFRPGVMYGDPMTTPGGKAIPYHASVRIRLASSTKEKDEEGDVFAIKTKAKCQKTRLGPPLRACEFMIMFDRGIDDVGSWREFLHEKGEIEKRAGFMVMKDVPVSVQVGEDKKGNPVFETQVQQEYKFRQSAWSDMIRGDAAFKEHVLSLLEKHLIVRYGERPSDIDEELVKIEQEENAA